MIVYVDRRKRFGAQISAAFAIGARGRIDHGSRLLPGPAAFWGITPNNAPILRRAIKEDRDWYYIDHCYLGERKRWYRVTRNAFQHSGQGEGDRQRLASMGVRLKPWRTDGRFILVCPPGELMCALRGWDRPHIWLARVKKTLAEYTDRPIVIREKPRADQLHVDRFENVLPGCWAVVTHISNTAIDAVLNGVPAFVTGECAARPVCGINLADIENPPRPERLEWASVLAANQWNKKEMRRGEAAKALGIIAGR